MYSLGGNPVPLGSIHDDCAVFHPVLPHPAFRVSPGHLPPGLLNFPLSQHGDKWRLSIINHYYHHITMGVVGAIVYVLGLWGPNFPYSCCLQHGLKYDLGPSTGCRILSSFYFTHTTQRGPLQTEGAHRTLKDIEALYRFG